MPITRKLVAHDENDSNFWLKVDHSSRFIQNDEACWQFLFGPNSSLSTSVQTLKVAVEFDKDNLDSVRFVAYFYNANTGSIGSMASVSFNVYLVTTPNWTEQYVGSFSGSLISNSYFFVDVPNSSMSTVDFFGGDTIMVEAVATRLSETYRDRLYFNHLGIYDNTTRLRNFTNFLDATKVDE